MRADKKPPVRQTADRRFRVLLLFTGELSFELAILLGQNAAGCRIDFDFN